jgi:hypothetical protein
MAGLYPELIQKPYGGFSLDPCADVVAYVRATQFANMPSDVAAKWVPTIADGLRRCRSGRNDVVVLLPGHTENIAASATSFAGLVAGTRIVGLGRGSNRPNLRWTATTSQLALSVADVTLSGCILRLEGAVVVKGIVVTAADCGIYDCDIDVGTTASTNLATIGIELGTGAHRFELKNNYIHGIAGATPTQVIAIAGVGDGAVIEGNDIMAATSVVSVGVIDITAAATGLRIRNNFLQNRVASSETVISCGAHAITGEISWNRCASEAGTPVSDLIELNAASLARLFDNKGTDTKNTSGLLTPAVVT